MQKNNDIYNQIKQQNGEAFAQAIRHNCAGLLDIPTLPHILKYAGRYNENLIEFLRSLNGMKIYDSIVSQDPFELLDKAGYNAYYADTLEKQNDPEFQKYFAPGEELCTFKDDTRFQRYYIINAVSKDVDTIHRHNFPRPSREDPYGRSVLSIQILKSGGFISIKNRYNHAVKNPDNTLGSNPDNIIFGLSASLRKYFNVDFSSQKRELPSGYVMINDQIVQYKEEINNVYIGDSYYIVDGKIIQINKNEELMIGHQFILNLKDKTVKDITNSHDIFTDVLARELHQKKLQVTRQKKYNDAAQEYYYETVLYADKQPILTMQDGFLVELNLPTTTIIKDNCLFRQETLMRVNAPALKEVGDYFLSRSGFGFCPTDLNFPSLERIGCHVLRDAQIGHFYAPELKRIQDYCLTNAAIGKLETPKLYYVGEAFLTHGCIEENLSLDNLTMVGGSFLSSAQLDQTEFSFPSLEYVGKNFMIFLMIKKIQLDKLVSADNGFLSYTVLTEFNAPSLVNLGDSALYSVNSLRTVNAPKLQSIGDDFMASRSNVEIEHVFLPELKKVGDNFMKWRSNIKRIYMPILHKHGSGFMEGYIFEEKKKDNPAQKISQHTKLNALKLLDKWQENTHK